MISDSIKITLFKKNTFEWFVEMEKSDGMKLSFFWKIQRQNEKDPTIKEAKESIERLLVLNSTYPPVKRNREIIAAFLA